MDAAQTIRISVERVSALRREGQSCPDLREAILAVKRFQAWRFTQTYAAELRAGPFRDAAHFFLEELYSEKDYTLRDEQFARIAGALQTLFPHQVVETAVTLAELHALTEELDSAMGKVWRTLDASGGLGDSERYAHAWRMVGRRNDRENQLRSVLAVGHELDQLTRTPGLRMMLKLMRRPAKAAGLSALQQFLERGFDTFAAMSQSRQSKGAAEFLTMVNTRETALLDRLYAQDLPEFCKRPAIPS